MPREYRQYGEGSGFITNSNGIILTNAHVVSGADRVKVTLKDGRTFPGTVRGIDQPLDLAVVKIEGRNKVASSPIGQSLPLKVRRGPQTEQLSVRPAELPDTAP
jgi:S1-C subfamily serine protease